MVKPEIMSALKAFEPQLRARGVRRLGVFGSQARGDAGPESDIDLLAELGGDVSYFDLMKIEADLTREMRKTVQITASPVRASDLRVAIERDIVPVF